jgi:hypothetical protein
MERKPASLGVLALLAGSLVLPARAASRGGGVAWCGTARDGAQGAIAAHREAEARRGPRSVALRAATVAGQVAVVPDEGDLALLRNPLDLQQAGLRFEAKGDGFVASRVDLAPLAGPGTRLDLGDDDSRPVSLPFPFAFYGRTHSALHVNSDGNLTFETADRASTARNLGRLLSGPPRVAPLLADLDPSAGGSVEYVSRSDRFTVSWTDVPQFDKTDRNTLQVTLYPDGRIEFAYGKDLSADLEEGVVGLAPGAEGPFTPLDLSAAAASGGTGAVAESFRAADGLDTVAVARKFYRSFPDEFDQLVVFTSRRLTPPRVFAYEQTVRNDVRGIGAQVFDSSAAYGSAGRLQSFVLMDHVEKYPDDLERAFLGADSALGVLAHEVGHRYLTQAVFRDGATTSRELLGRDEVHWSFFLDTDGSHLEGNDIQDAGGGRFRTTAAGVRYSPLDQYLMGLRAAEEVPPFFFVRSPVNTDSDPGRDPEPGVSFDGTRKDVAMADVLAAMGPRSPAHDAAPRSLRQAFLFVNVGGAASAAHLDKVERMRSAFPAFYQRSTDGRGATDPSLN